MKRKSGRKMKEFDYGLDYKTIDFTVKENRKLYRIGRGEQGVLLVRPYTNLICAHWRFVNEDGARKSASKIYSMFCDYKKQRDFIGMDMARKFLEMGFTRSRGMQIILVERSTLAMVPYHRSRQPHYTVKSRVLQLFSKK